MQSMGVSVPSLPAIVYGRCPIRPIIRASLIAVGKLLRAAPVTFRLNEATVL